MEARAQEQGHDIHGPLAASWWTRDTQALPQEGIIHQGLHPLLIQVRHTVLLIIVRAFPKTGIAIGFFPQEMN